MKYELETRAALIRRFHFFFQEEFELSQRNQNALNAS